jgi:2-polyprenyl-3-methyl-5-hydroxy-6-metoxy-1,4-benzoquinol methylase
MENKIAAWNKRYQTAADTLIPCQVLAEYSYLLPSSGTALDLACGLGANALLLAKKGLTTHAWDTSETAIQRLVAYAQTSKVSLQAEVRDVIRRPPATNQFDVIVVCHFLARELATALMNALKINGLLFYQTFTLSCVDTQGPRNPLFRLTDNELLKLFNPLQVVIYREEGLLGETTRGFRNEALFIGQKKQVTNLSSR